jgi:predicted nuclease of predicted toxin-antitoxin system
MVTVLLDQNISREIMGWLSGARPQWKILHAKDLGFSREPDEVLYAWAQQNSAVIVTFDEDFADARMRALGPHHGIIRLKVWPTTVENTRSGLDRLLQSVPDDGWLGSLVIIDNQKIRIRRGRP